MARHRYVFSSLVLARVFAVDDEHRARRVADGRLGDAAEQEPAQAAATMAAHDAELELALLEPVLNALGCRLLCVVEREVYVGLFVLLDDRAR